MDENDTTQTGNGDTPRELINPADLGAEQITQAMEETQAEAQELIERDPADLSEAEAARIEQLADHLDALEARQGELTAEVEQRAERARAAAERITGRGDDGDDGEPGDEAPADEAPAEDAEVEAAPEAVAAAGARPAPRRAPVRPAARRQATPARQASGELVSITAAADVGGGISSGASLNEPGMLAKAFQSRSKAFSGMRGAGYSRLNVASIERRFDNTTDGLYVGNPDYPSVQGLFEAAARESRLGAKGLTAAGWCSPSEILYGIPDGETTDGIIDLPTVGIEHGGVSFTPGPDFADIFTGAGFSQTEAQAIANEVKACAEIDCPDFQEVRLDAVGFCVVAPLLTRAAWPEVITRWINGTQVAVTHKTAARLITSMRNALGTALAPTLTGTPITWSLLTALELVCEGQRQAYRLSESDTLEVVAPRWLRIAVRADLANRNGIDERSVSNAQINEHFADRGVAVQWVLNYQELANPLTNVAFPSTVEVMVYPAGTFVRGSKTVVNLDTVYDNDGLTHNNYTAAFVEDGVLLAKMRHGGKRINLPVNVTGLLGAAQMDDSWGTAQVENAGAASA